MSLSRVTRAFRTSSLRASLQFGGVSTQRIGLTTTLTTDLFGASPSTTIVGTKVLPVSNPLSYRYFTSIDSSSDSQFQPIIKKKDDHSEEMEQMLSEIKEVVTNNDIVLFMKGTPDHPNCGFSYRVVQVLAKLSKSLSQSGHFLRSSFNSLHPSLPSLSSLFFFLRVLSILSPHRIFDYLLGSSFL